MRKLVLELESLRVESFETEAAAPARGTVRGQDDSQWKLCETGEGESCYRTGCEYDSCMATCDNASCVATRCVAQSCAQTCANRTCDPTGPYDCW